MYSLLIILNIFCYISASVLKPDHRIVNGEPIDITRTPYQAAFSVYNAANPVGAVCGAAIISEYYLLTAAHCAVLIPDISGKRVIGVGSSLLTEMQWYEVERSEWHSSYDGNDIGKGHDIAYIKLRQPLQFSDKVRKIDLTDSEPGYRQTVYASGWGLIAGGSAPNQLQGVDMFVDNNYWYDETVLLINNDRADTHVDSGDSGGPLAWQNKLVGITSFKTIGQNYCGYANIDKLRGWIREKTGI